MCGKKFEPSNNAKIYCCSECRNKAEREEFKLLRPAQICVCCGKEFVPKRVAQKTCGNELCKRALFSKKQKSKIVRRRKNMSDKTWNNLSPSDRWRLMTLVEVDKECKRFHFSYGQMQCLYHHDKLPESFGKRGVK